MRTIFRKKLLIIVGVAAFIVSWLSLDLVDRNCRLHVSKLFNEACKDTLRALATSDKRAYDSRSTMMHKVLTSLETVTEVVNYFPGIEHNYLALERLRSSLGISRIDILDPARQRVVLSTDPNLQGKPINCDLPAPLSQNDPDFNSFISSMGSYHPVDYVLDRHQRELLLFYNPLRQPDRLLRLAFNAQNFRMTYDVATHELVTSSLSLGETGGVDVIQGNGVIVNSVDKECIGANILEVYSDFQNHQEAKGLLLRVNRRGTPSYCSYYPTQYGYSLICYMSASEVYATRRTVLQVMLIGYFLLFVAIFFSTSYLVKVVVLNGLERINASLAKIEAGDLEVKVEEDSCPEFCALSQGINSTVQALKSLMESQLAHDAEQMALARTIQLSCLPKFFPTYPEVRELDLYARTTPAQEVGGDFYDYFRISDNLYCVMIADVSEHGIPAALLMMTAKTALHDAVLSGDTLEHCIESVNSFLCENNSTCMFVTAFVATLNIATGEFRFVNAGHCRPMLKRAQGQWESVAVQPGMVLGGIDNLNYQSEGWILKPGDQVFLYTDGVSEASDPQGQMFGVARLQAILNRPSCAHYDGGSLINLVQDELENFTQGDFQDDVTMVALEYFSSLHADKFLQVSAQPEELDKILDFVNATLERAQLEPKRLQELRAAVDTAVDDIFTNIVSYATTGSNRQVQVTVRAEISLYPHQLILHFIDNGHPYAPTAATLPDIDCPFQDRPCGGLGIYLVKKLTDHMTYRYTEGRNILCLVKNLE